MLNSHDNILDIPYMEIHTSYNYLQTNPYKLLIFFVVVSSQHNARHTKGINTINSIHNSFTHQHINLLQKHCFLYIKHRSQIIVKTTLWYKYNSLSIYKFVLYVTHYAPFTCTNNAHSSNWTEIRSIHD